MSSAAAMMCGMHRAAVATAKKQGASKVATAGICRRRALPFPPQAALAAALLPGGSCSSSGRPGGDGRARRARAFGSASAAVPPPTSTAVPAPAPAAPRVPTAPTPGVGCDEEQDLTPFCLDLRGLNERLRRELPERPQRGAPIDQDVVDRVMEVLKNTKLNPREWKQHAVFRRGRYTRNIVGYSPGQFIALLLCWERGQQSPIHDHSGAHCFVKMLTGRLKEEQFDWAPGRQAAKPEVIGEAMLDASVRDLSVSFAHDDTALHRISNPDNEEVAVSLHIYSPPFEDCLVFPPTGAAARRAPMVSINAPAFGSLTGGSSGTCEASMLQPSGLPPPPALSEMCTSLSRIGQALGWELPSEPGAAPSPSAPDPFQILDLLGPVEMSPLEWAKLAGPAHFSEFHCTQNLIHCDAHFSVMVSCWSPGQGIQPHHIGKGRKEWVKVVHGSLKYQEIAPGLFWGNVDSESELPEGSSTVLRESAARTRSVVNASDTASAISIHIFSPPLTQFAFRTEKGIERKCVPMIAGALTSDVAAGAPGLADGPAPSETPAAREIAAAAVAAAAHSAGVDATAEAWAGRAEPATSARGLLTTAGRRYLSFRALTKLLDEELVRPDCLDDAVTALLRKAVFNPEEWRGLLASASEGGLASSAASAGAQVDRPKSVVLAERRDYKLVLCFWGQRAQETSTAAQRGGCGRSWTLILEGELEERAFAPRPAEASSASTAAAPRNGAGASSALRRRLLRVSTLKEESVSFIAGGEEVQLCCDSDVPCVSLHLLSPPLLE